MSTDTTPAAEPGIEIEHAECPKCRQQAVLRDDGELARHRLPAPRPLRWEKGFLVLGPWCHEVTAVQITDRSST